MGVLTVRVDRDLCEGNAVCVRNAPEAFRIGPQDSLTILIEHPEGPLRAKVQKAVDFCPRGALSLEESTEK
jgi:ferredoxin